MDKPAAAFHLRLCGVRYLRRVRPFIHRCEQTPATPSTVRAPPASGVTSVPGQPPGGGSLIKRPGMEPDPMVGAHGRRPQPNPPGVAPVEVPPEQHHIGRSAIGEHPTRQGHPATVCQRVTATATAGSNSGSSPW